MALCVSLIFGFLLICTSFAYSQESAPETPTIVNQVFAAQPSSVGSSGAFRQRVAISVPEYMGLEPNIALTYASSNRRRGRVDNLIAVGWNLSGFSKIERVSPGGGTPWYDDAKDIFLLDGGELLLCSGQTGDYPNKYKATGPSASCSAGGTHTSLSENYLKITKVNSDKWEVRRKDGTVFEYDGLGTATSTTGTTADEITLLTDKTWVLTKVSDLQTTANEVNYSYAIESSTNGYAHRPSSVDYSGYSASFHYTDLADPITYANGTGNMGQQTKRLSAIEIKDSTTQIRAYDLDFATSTETLQSLLTDITEYGDDYVITANVVASGASLPAWQFSYSEDSMSYPTGAVGDEPTEYTSFGLHTVDAHTKLLIADYNNDGRDEIWFQGYEKLVPLPPDGAIETLANHYYEFDNGGAIVSEQLVNTPIEKAQVINPSVFSSLTQVETQVAGVPGSYDNNRLLIFRAQADYGGNYNRTWVEKYEIFDLFSTTGASLSEVEKSGTYCLACGNPRPLVTERQFGFFKDDGEIGILSLGTTYDVDFSLGTPQLVENTTSNLDEDLTDIDPNLTVYLKWSCFYEQVCG